MESCERYREALSARLDGELSAEETEELEAHLAVCPACRAYARQLDALREGFTALEEVSAPEGFAPEVESRIRAEEKRRAARVRRIRAAAGLAACLVLCGGIWFAVRRGQPAAETISCGESAGSSLRIAPAPREEGDGSGAPDADLPAPASLEPEESFAVRTVQTLRVTPSPDAEMPSACGIRSAETLSAFLANFPREEASAVCASYDSAFFEDHSLLAVLLEMPEEAGGPSLEAVTESRVTVRCPAEGDGAVWLVLAEVFGALRDGQSMEVLLTP